VTARNAQASTAYPRYIYFPRWQAAPAWVVQVVQVFAVQQPAIDTATLANTSDVILQLVRPGLETLGFQVEAGKLRENKLFRPVFFGENGQPERQYQIDSYHPQEGDCHVDRSEAETGPRAAGSSRSGPPGRASKTRSVCPINAALGG